MSAAIADPQASTALTAKVASENLVIVKRPQVKESKGTCIAFYCGPLLRAGHSADDSDMPSVTVWALSAGLAFGLCLRDPSGLPLWPGCHPPCRLRCWSPWDEASENNHMTILAKLASWAALPLSNLASAV